MILHRAVTKVINMGSTLQSERPEVQYDLAVESNVVICEWLENVILFKSLEFRNGLEIQSMKF